jgi:signal transduction histidine kinase
MKRISKLFAAWATSSKAEPFQRARLKLTAYYITGIVILLAIFNLGVYGLFVSDVPDTFEASLSISQRQTIDQAGQLLERVLVLVNSVMIIVVSWFGYYLSGRTLRPIEAVYKRQKKFVADAAHELRTPLAVMKTGAETALVGQFSAKSYEKLTRESLEEIDYMAETVNNLLFLAQNDSHKKIEFARIDLGRLVSKQVETMQPHAWEKGIKIEHKLGAGCYIRGNTGYLKRLLANLLQNAIDYNKPKGMVTVSLEQNKQGVELRIVDSGIGIAPEHFENIFDRFYKADKSRSRQSGGAGLGLAIVKEIVALHQGQVVLHSELGKGTSVVVTLPASS